MPREHASCLPSHLLYVNAFSPMDLSSSPLGMVYGVMDTAVLWIMGHKPSSLLLCVCFKNKQYAWRMWTIDGMSRSEERARISFYSSSHLSIPTLMLFNWSLQFLYFLIATISFVRLSTALYTSPWYSTITTDSHTDEILAKPNCWSTTQYSHTKMGPHSPTLLLEKTAFHSRDEAFRK